MCLGEFGGFRTDHLCRIERPLAGLVGNDFHSTEQAAPTRIVNQRMIAQAESKGANAILSVRFTTSSVAQGASEILAYGSAVVVE